VHMCLCAHACIAAKPRDKAEY